MVQNILEDFVFTLSPLGERLLTAYAVPQEHLLIIKASPGYVACPDGVYDYQYINCDDN
jgi:hypothetical protein